MLSQLGRLYGIEWDRRAYAELTAAIGAGTVAKVAAGMGLRQLAKFLPVYGQTAGAAASAAASFAVTYALGKAAVYYLHGRRLGTGSVDQTARLWDIATGQPSSIYRGHTDQITSITFSPDGRRLATSSYDHTAKLWDVTTGRVLITFAGHTGRISAIVFSSDGLILATAGEDRTAKVGEVSLRVPITNNRVAPK